LTDKKKQTGFISEVEALRGVAAFSVVVEHCLLPLSASIEPGLFSGCHGVQPILHWLLHTTFNGRASVMLFFAISGFVLGRQVGTAPILTPSAWCAFTVRRLFRIVPAMWLAILLAYLVAQWRQMPAGANGLTFARTLILQDTSLLPPLWSLNVEMGCSLVFPVLLSCGRRIGLVGNLVLLLALGGLIYRVPWPPWDLRIEFARYLVLFQAGLMAGSWGVALWQTLRPSMRWSLLTFAAVGYGLIPQLWAFSATYAFYADQRNWLPGETLCCFIILVSVIAGTGRRETAWLRTRVAKFLGRISYSLYLFHSIVLSIFYTIYSEHTDWALYHRWPLVMQMVLLAVVTVSSVLLSVAVFEFVERPLTRWGRDIAGWITVHAPENHFSTGVNQPATNLTHRTLSGPSRRPSGADRLRSAPLGKSTGSQRT